MNELVVRNQVVSTYDEVERAAKAMVASGYFADTKAISQGIVKILAGQEIGFGPFASMNGVYIIQGKPSFGANMMAAAVKASGRYNYRVVEMSDEVCEIAFIENGQECGRSKFTIADAKKAGTKNLDKFPRNMLFARAMSNGVRWYCPDVMNGSAIYTPEELGVETDEDGKPLEPIISEVIDVETDEDGKPLEPIISEVIDVEPVQEKSRSQINAELGFGFDEPAKVEPMTIEKAYAIKNSEGVSYGEIDSDKLSKMRIGIRKALNNGAEGDARQLYEDKLAAINLLLKERAANTFS